MMGKPRRVRPGLHVPRQIVGVMHVPNTRGAAIIGGTLPEVLHPPPGVIPVGDSRLGLVQVPAGELVQASTSLRWALLKDTPDQTGQKAGVWS